MSKSKSSNSNTTSEDHVACSDEDSTMKVTQYSEKSIVVRGSDTKIYKEDLKTIGGKYNASLQGGAGWIFPSTKETKVKSLVASKYNKKLRVECKTKIQNKIEKVIQQLKGAKIHSFYMDDIEYDDLLVSFSFTLYTDHGVFVGNRIHLVDDEEFRNVLAVFRPGFDKVLKNSLINHLENMEDENVDIDTVKVYNC